MDYLKQDSTVSRTTRAKLETCMNAHRHTHTCIHACTHTHTHKFLTKPRKSTLYKVVITKTMKK